MKKLTNDGLVDEEVNEVKEINLPEEKKEEKQEEPEKKEFKKLPQVEERPIENKKSLKIKRSTIISLWIIFGIIALLFTIDMVWSNILFGSKDFSPDVTLNNDNNILPANITNEFNQTNVNNNENNFTINIDVGDELAETIAEKVLEIINNETNSS